MGFQWLHIDVSPGIKLETHLLITYEQVSVPATTIEFTDTQCADE